MKDFFVTSLDVVHSRTVVAKRYGITDGWVNFYDINEDLIYSVHERLIISVEVLP